MRIKRVLILFPVTIGLVLLQSFFWVPTYDKQAERNPDRLYRYVESSSGDAQILNPALSADAASSAVNDLVFEGLIALDDNLDYRPRLAKSWIQYENAYLVIDPGARFWLENATSGKSLPGILRKAMVNHKDWLKKIFSIEVLPAEKIKGSKPLGGGANGLKVSYVLHRPAILKFSLNVIDQDFFKPLRGLLGNDYFDRFPYDKFIFPEKSEYRAKLAKFYGDILPVAEHNPVLEFELRQGVGFHDGHEFDSGDVLFTYQEIMNPLNASPRTSDYEPIKKIRALGKYKVRIVYKRLFSPAVNSWFMGILPEHLLNKKRLKEEAKRRGLTGDKLEKFSLRDSKFNRRPVGTGPFVFREWKADEMIRLTRNKNYWEGPPEYRDYIIRVIPDSLTQEIEFLAGAVDNYAVQPHQVARFKENPKYQRFSSIGYQYSYIGYNLRNPLFADRRVRKALGMAIDVEKIIKYILYGEGERVTGPFPKITDWYDPEIKPLPYNPDGALEILNELGWEKNSEGVLEKEGKEFEFNLITNNGNPTRKNILSIAQNGWEKLGIKCNTQLFEWAVFLKDFVNPGKFDALVLGWSMGVDPDLYQIWHSSQTHPRQLNFVGYENLEADRLIVRIRREYDKTEQIKLTHNLHRIIARDQPYTFLYVGKTTRLMDRKIVIVERDESGEENYKKIYPTRDGQISYYFNKWKKLAKAPDFLARD